MIMLRRINEDMQVRAELGHLFLYLDSSEITRFIFEENQRLSEKVKSIDEVRSDLILVPEYD